MKWEKSAGHTTTQALPFHSAIVTLGNVNQCKHDSAFINPLFSL